MFKYEKAISLGIAFLFFVVKYKLKLCEIKLFYEYTFYICSPMKRFINKIWLLILLVAISGVTNEAFSEENVSDAVPFSVIVQEPSKAVLSTPNRNSLPEAELGGISWNGFKDFSSRAQRTLNTNYVSFRNTEKELIYHSEVLAKHKSKYYHSSVSPITYPTCEYYVFALRQIVI